jgi:hypothetical protein
MSEQGKVYILYVRPVDDPTDDDTPISEVWSDGKKPPNKYANTGRCFVYDRSGTEGKDLINEREWEG